MKARFALSIKIFVFVFIFFISKYQVTNCSDISIPERKCKEDLFPKPYVLLKSSKAGPAINKLETQGVMDLRQAVDAYLCVNGPVIIYGGVSSHIEPVEPESTNNTNSTETTEKPVEPNKGEGDRKNNGTVVQINIEDKNAEGEPKNNDTTNETPQSKVKLKPGETLRFSNGSFKMFSHKCMHINRITKRELEKMKNHGDGTPTVASNTTVAGIKATGIFLIASEEPYSPGGPPLKIMFNRKAFGYKVGVGESIIKDASFVAVGKGPFCISLKDGSKIVMNSTAEDDKAICRWTIKEDYRRHEEGKKYLKLIKVARDKEQYSWEDCPSDALEQKNNESDTGTNDTIIPQHGSSSPFAINKPGSSSGQERRNNKMLGYGQGAANGTSSDFHRKTDDDVSSEEIDGTSQYGRNRRTTNNEPNQPESNNEQDKTKPNNDQEKIKPSNDNNQTNSNDGQTTTNNGQDNSTNIGNEPVAATAQNIKYFIELKDCVSPPEFDPKDPLCEFIKEDNLNCEKLSTAMELEEDDGKGKGGEKSKGNGGRKRNPQNKSQSSTQGSSEGPLTLGGNPLLKWKDEVLHLVAKIFSKICVPIKEQSVFKLIKLIGNYIATAHTNNPEASEEYGKVLHKTNLWDILISSLDRCCQSNKTVPMHWRWSENIKVPTNSGKVRRKRTKRRVRMYAPASSAVLAKTLMFDNVNFKSHNVAIKNLEELEVDDKPKLIIQRSSSVFDFDDNDERTNEIVYGTIPRQIKRQTKNISVPIPRIQEYVPPAPLPTDDPSPSSRQPRGDSSNRLLKKGEIKRKHEDFMFHPDPGRIRIHGFPLKQIFYYEDEAQYMMDLNKVIDAFWKVLATVLGFCQMSEISRGNAVFPLLLHNFQEYFLDLMKDQWKNPPIEQEVDMVMGEFLDEDRAKWLDTCLETAYIVSDSLHFRPARPVDVYSMESDGKNGTKMKPNGFIDTPENMPGGGRSYFTRNVKIKG